MTTIPLEERLISDEEVLQAFDLTCPGLECVHSAILAGDISQAKKELLGYLETRSNIHYYYDYRRLPLQKIDTDSDPNQFQASLGLRGSLKEFCLFAGQKMMDHIYVRPGSERLEFDLGPNYENLFHFNFLEDQGKKHRTFLDIFVRGQFFEYLCILYHETGDRKVLDSFEETLIMFLEHYPLTVECTAADTDHFSLTEERDVMSAGWLTLCYISLFYTRIPYEIPSDLAFELIKRIWFLGIQFRRFDTDTYRRYNHHMWERGLVPFFLGTLLPEIPDFLAMKELGASVVRQHIRDDFNEDGGYSEHSIPYWCGAALGEMICKGAHLARLNREPLLDDDTRRRIDRSFDVLALISPPGNCYPSLGDNGGPMVNPVLHTGFQSTGNRLCKEILDIRQGRSAAATSVPLDYCNDKTGFFCSKSSLLPDASYVLMSAKKDCGDSGHNHMDLLSLFVSIRGQEFIGEPHARQLYHTVCAGDPLRGYLYNMESHNTVLAYGNPIQPDHLYALKWGVLRPDTPVTAFTSTEDGCYVCAYHDAYTFCRHTRKILSCREKGFLIRDELRGGDRLPQAHIQRWHLFPDVTCRLIDNRSLLLEKNGVKALCLWSGTPTLHLWQKQDLYPRIVKERNALSTIVDVSFTASISNESIIGTVSQDLLILDVTGYPIRIDNPDVAGHLPVIDDIDTFCSHLFRDADNNRLSDALLRLKEIR